MTEAPDCVLVRPSEGPGYRFYRENLGLGYVAAFLRRAGFRVEIVDGTIDGLTTDQIAARILDAPPALVGFSLFHAEAFRESRRIVAALRQGGYAGHVTMGQHFATFNAERILTDAPEIDSIVRFEGEETARELLESIQSGRDLASILGLTYRGTGGRVTSTPPRPLVADLDRLPFPARDVLDRNRDRLTTINISASRGCPWRCKFCSVATFYRIPNGSIWRHRSPANVVDEIEGLVGRYGSRPFFFVDDQFMGSGRRGREAARTLARELLSRGLGIRFSVETRADTIDPESFELLRRAGLYLVFVGVESGYQPTLDLYQKDISVEQNLAAIKLLQQLDLDIQMGFIMFHERTTFDEIRANLDFLEATGAFDPLSLFSELLVYSGTGFMSDRGEGPLTAQYEAPWEIADAGARQYQRHLSWALLPFAAPAETLALSRRSIAPLSRAVTQPCEQRLRAVGLRIARRLLQAAETGAVSAQLLEDLWLCSEAEGAALERELATETARSRGKAAASLHRRPAPSMGG